MSNTKKFEFLANVKDLSQHCVPQEDKNECFVQFKLAGYKRLGVSFSGLVLRFGKDTWDKQEVKDVLLPRGVYRITIERVERDLLSFLNEKKKDASTTKQDENTYYLLKEHPKFLSKVLKFLLHFYKVRYFEDWNGRELTDYELDVKKTYRYDIINRALSQLMDEGTLETWDSWSLRNYREYHEGMEELYARRQKLEDEARLASRIVPSLVKAFGHPIKSALLSKYDEMQEGMDQVQQVIKKAKKKKRKKCS